MDDGTVHHSIKGAEDKDFAKRNQGKRCTMRAVVGYCASEDTNDSVEIYEGDLDGVIVFPARGASPYGWNRCFLPDGHRTVRNNMKAPRFYLCLYAHHPTTVVGASYCTELNLYRF
jgi:inosine/xanthosine triphosphate pyrophosphatase family protein